MKSMNRKERILKLIVEQFIQTAEPVGSSSLIESLNCSSATIRNEMKELEDMGFLEKTHTSSGRVPSAQGYRYYVDHLRDSVDDLDLRYQLQSLFDVNQQLNVEEAIKHGCEIISQMTNLTSVVLGPDAQYESIKKIQLIPVSEKVAVAIFVTDSGHVENKTFEIPTGVAFKDLETCVNVVGERIVGTPINKVVDKVEALKPILADKIQNYEVVFKAFLEAFLKFTYERVSVYGAANMFDQPEFVNDIEKLKRLITLVESDKAWSNIDDFQGISVRIGSENTLTEFDDVSVIQAEIKVDDTQRGRVVLLGPTRMDYHKALKAVEYLQEQLNEFFKFDKKKEE